MSQDPTYLVFIIKHTKFVNYSKLGLRRWNVQRPKPSQTFLSPSPLQTPIHYQPTSSLSSSFLSSCHHFPHLQSPDIYVPSPFPLPYFFFPSFRSHPYSIQLQQAPSTHCPSVSGAVWAPKSVLAFNPYSWQHIAPRAHEILLSLFMPKAHWILRELKCDFFFP